MKKIIITLAIMIFGLQVNAQENWKDGMQVGINGGGTLESLSSIKPMATYWGLSLVGGYKKHLVKGLFVTPELSVFYHNYSRNDNYDYPYWVGGVNEGPLSDNIDSWDMGIGIDAMIGYSIPVYSYSNRFLDIMTGPYFGYAFITKDKMDKYYKETIDPKKTDFRWRFAIALNISHIGLKMGYDIGITDLDLQSRRHNCLFGGVAYSF